MSYENLDAPEKTYQAIYFFILNRIKTIFILGWK